MLKDRIFVHQINQDHTFPFDANVYSKFKFGCLASSDSMGKELAERFIQYDRWYNILKPETELAIAASAYNKVPVASVQLKDAFVKYLSPYLKEMGYKPIVEIKVDRKGSHSQDYGMLDSSQRFDLIKTDIFRVDKKDVENRTVLFIDDIRVTGTHEQIAQRMIKRTRTKFDYYYLYYASVTPFVDCRVENTLNKYKIDSAWELSNLLREENFTINVRMLKFILSLDEADAKGFFKECTIDFLRRIHWAALSEKYYRVSNYRKIIINLKRTINELRSQEAVSA